ncbi:MAG TPA: response regulator transcription factor [Jatrophihabitans sp.]|jgi:two-component system KDP operon response regulator KdpE|uniref:response regulator transcription factor n=1 Tax=Jatrophihabitans sp. TaxID=1932789 RepID=UPI002DFB08A1|nr:response regulator transcription factor [Jatrophihabitans sp.]
MSAGRILLVEDEKPLLRALAMNLVARGYAVTEAETGTKALTALADHQHDVIVLDLGLPDMSGVDVIRAVRAYASTPIIVLSARSGSADKVEALDLGADDYVTKPFSMDELLARLRATSRRVATADEAVTATVGSVHIDLTLTTATDREGNAVHLTPTEWKILDVLLRRPGKLVSGDALLTAVRGSSEHTDPSYLRIYLAQLRRKLEPEPSRPRHLITEPGMGYRYRP